MAAVRISAEEVRSSRVKAKIKLIEEPVSRSEVEIVVEKAFGSGARLVNYQTRSYSTEKLGFMGTHQHLVVRLEPAGSSGGGSGGGRPEVHTFFLKGIPQEIEVQAKVIAETRAFVKEASFYRELVPELTRGMKDKSWLAECYLTNARLMVFEDLKAKSYAIREKILEEPALRSALGALGKLHAASILTERRLGKSILELFPDNFNECLFVKQGSFASWFRNGVKLVEAIARSIGLEASRVAPLCERIFQLIEPSKSRQNVVCHGDAWSYNIMFDETRPIPKCVLVDFQLVRYLPGAADLAQLLYLTLRREVRERLEEDMLRHYHEALCQALRENSGPIELPSLEELLHEYEEMRLVGLITANLYFPIMLTDGNVTADICKDSQGFADYMFGDKSDLVLTIMRNDPLYNDRIVEVVKELVDKANHLP